VKSFSSPFLAIAICWLQTITMNLQSVVAWKYREILCPGTFFFIIKSSVMFCINRSHPDGTLITPLIRQVRVRSDSNCHKYGFLCTPTMASVQYLFQSGTNSKYIDKFIKHHHCMSDILNNAAITANREPE
jgi:hypothetical protein